MATVTLNLEVSDQFCADIIGTAIEGGTNYWAQVRKLKRTNPSDGMWSYISCEMAELNDDETGYDWKNPRKLDYAVVRAGIEKLLAPGFSIRSDIRDAVARSVLNPEDADIDADAADAIVQAAFFGELKYG